MSTFVFSIHHECAEKIYSGEKTVELRSVLPANPALKAGDSVALYETKPIGRITGSFAAAEDASYDASNTLGLCLSVLAERSCVTTDYVERHSNLRIRNPEAVNDQKATWQIGAIKVKDPVRFGKPRPLSDYGLKRAPQSWCRAKKDQQKERIKMKPILYSRVYISPDQKKVYVLSWDCDGVYVTTFDRQTFDSLFGQDKPGVIKNDYCGTKLKDAMGYIESENGKEDSK